MSGLALKRDVYISEHYLRQPQSYPEEILSLSSEIRECFDSNTTSAEIFSQIAIKLQKFGVAGVKQTVTKILQTEQLLQYVAKVSYLHGNGFYKIRLFDTDDFSIRLHIWMPGIHSQENLHNHRWHFASTVLSGTLESEIWNDSASRHASAYDEYIYIDKIMDPIKIGIAKVELTKEESYATGVSYFMKPDDLHRIIIAKDMFVATLMCRSAQVRDWARNVDLNFALPEVKPIYLENNSLKEILEKYLHLSECANIPKLQINNIQ